ncbi:FHA domain-containing protein [Fusarium keratoplasticum]|uniref:FHA domain-containing protein n=1 Tax=Fusarium keratoplasticum TaxID=1328300 RepID=A0ACC0QYX4_9HYPO|nr:FHA domain-containing protein [Fusarium keratoplasticum]KAI8669553.1 FHA domain-containing protein [Fusarium keratoplasticum]
MTAVANPPNFPISRPAWAINGHHQMNSDEARGGMGMFMPRKTLTRSNSSSSVSSTSSNSSTTTVATNGSHTNGTPLSSTTDLSQWSANGAPRKRPQPKNPWPAGKGDFQQDLSRVPAGRGAGMMAHGPVQAGPGQVQMSPQAMMRPMTAEQFPPGQPVLYLLSLNGTFERKTIAVPFAPESLRIGRQTNQKTIPTPTNGFFDSKVLSRQHAEIYAERNGKIYIRDVKSSNGTFVNGTRLSQENRESEPHELQTSDHLELGIDIVSEDQKTVVHHKVAAKVEHAGFLSASSNVLDMNFGDLDPANGAMMMPSGPQMRGRAGSNASMASNGRMMPNGGMMNMQANGMPQQRPFFLTPVATDQILKRLANEMRNARLQAQDLGRTNQFVHTLLSKDDLKDLDKPEGLEPPKPQPIVNGMGTPFRADPKARFSDPPAPPPQQPLPEKPDVPSLKRGPTERPKSGPPNTSPIRPDNLSQIVQLTEALNNAKRDIDSQTARMRELEEMLQKERLAREEAEELAKRLEESATSHMNGSALPGELEAPEEEPEAVEEVVPETPVPEVVEETTPAVDAAQETATALQARIDIMENQMRDMKEQMEEWKQRCEMAESERDADRKTLAEMVVQLRAEEALREEAEKRARSRSRRRNSEAEAVATEQTPASEDAKDIDEKAGVVEPVVNDESSDAPTLSRANTITPSSPQKGALAQEKHLHAGLPYASMIGVVLFGVGLMAYLNGWQAQPPRPEQ